jgi:hypothetical protein
MSERKLIHHYRGPIVDVSATIWTIVADILTSFGRPS